MTTNFVCEGGMEVAFTSQNHGVAFIDQTIVLHSVEWTLDSLVQALEPASAWSLERAVSEAFGQHQKEPRFSMGRSLGKRFFGAETGA